MKKIDFDNGAALLALAVVILGVLAAAESAFAGTESANSDRLPARTETAAETVRQDEMADEAIRTLEKANELALDIQLGDHKSVADAGNE